MTIPSIAQAASDPAFKQYLTDLLVEVCRIDTTPHADVSVSRANEARIFDILEREFAGYGFEASAAERRPMDPAIAKHPYFSNLYYTMTPERPKGLTPKQCYAGRSNLILKIDAPEDPVGSAGPVGHGHGVGQAIDVHIDVIAPYFPPRVEGDRVYGRGACDDKGNAVALMGALKLLGSYLKTEGKRLHRHFTGLIVIEEETGGNGSLSIALDRELKARYDSLVVLEICDSRLHPGNRGAVWYKVEGKVPGVNLFEAAAFVIEEMEKEGRALRAESDHPLFPHRPVQTCHGVIGGSGQHPSRINGDVSFDLVLTPAAAGEDAGTTPAAGQGPSSVSAPGDGAGPGRTDKLVRDLLDDAVAQYVGLYGDKTKVTDPSTGKPKVDHHYDLTQTEGGYRVRVWGSTGHMGSILVNDGAITKMMTMARALIRGRAAVSRAAGGATVELRLADWADPSHLVLEGGQGFLPTHAMPEVQERMRQAVWRGAEHYLRLVAPREGASPTRAARSLKVSYDKLHNAAFAGAADSPDMRHALEAARDAGIWKDEPVRGWDVSCDSRIFAGEYPEMPVITTGPGSLQFAHSDAEQIQMSEVVQFAEFLAYYILKQTGTA